MQYGILKVSEATIERIAEDVSVHTGNVEHHEQLADVFRSGRRPHSLGGQIVDGGHGGGADEPIKPTGVHQTHDLFGSTHMRLAGEELIEYYVRIEKHLHRYFSSR
jgi:hypothetical protein